MRSEQQRPNTRPEALIGTLDEATLDSAETALKALRAQVTRAEDFKSRVAVIPLGRLAEVDSNMLVAGRDVPAGKAGLADLPPPPILLHDSQVAPNVVPLPLAEPRVVRTGQPDGPMPAMPPDTIGEPNLSHPISPPTAPHVPSVPAPQPVGASEHAPPAALVPDTTALVSALSIAVAQALEAVPAPDVAPLRQSFWANAWHADVLLWVIAMLIVATVLVAFAV